MCAIFHDVVADSLNSLSHRKVCHPGNVWHTAGACRSNMRPPTAQGPVDVSPRSTANDALDRGPPWRSFVPIPQD